MLQISLHNPVLPSHAGFPPWRAHPQFCPWCLPKLNVHDFIYLFIYVHHLFMQHIFCSAHGAVVHQARHLGLEFDHGIKYHHSHFEGDP